MTEQLPPLKKARYMEMKEDQISGLPDAVRLSILSLLTTREAVGTSILSTEWRNLWRKLSVLQFDSPTILGMERTEEKELHKGTFVESIDQLLKLHVEILGQLRIHFPLNNEFGPHIDEWIKIALEKKVGVLDLNLSPKDKKNPYAFPHELLVSEEPSRLMHLILSSCVLKVPEDCSVLKSLGTLELDNISLGEECITNILSQCLLLRRVSLRKCGELKVIKFDGPISPLTTLELDETDLDDKCFSNIISQFLELERLSLSECKKLKNIKFDSPSNNLKSFIVKKIANLVEFEITAPSLLNFEYEGSFVAIMLLKKTTQLKTLKLHFGTCGALLAAIALKRFLGQHPQLLTLSFKIEGSKKAQEMVDKLPVDSYLKIENLEVIAIDQEDLMWMTSVLDVFPCLQKLKLFVRFNGRKREITNRHIVPHFHLKTIELFSNVSELNQAKFLCYVLKYVPSLRNMLIGDLCIKHAKFGKEKKPRASWADAREMLFRELTREIPLSVDLDILS